MNRRYFFGQVAWMLLGLAGLKARVPKSIGNMPIESVTLTDAMHFRQIKWGELKVMALRGEWMRECITANHCAEEVAP